MKKHKRLLVFQCKYTKTPMSKFECFGHAVKGQIYYEIGQNARDKVPVYDDEFKSGMHIPWVTFCMDIVLKTGSTRGENIEKKWDDRLIQIIYIKKHSGNIN